MKSPGARRPLPKELAGDDVALDLIGPLVDLGDLGVSIQTLDLESADIAAAAENLHRVGGVLDRGVGGEALGHRAFQSHPLATCVPMRRRQRHQACRVRVLGHVGEHPLNPLELRDRGAELAACLGVVQASLERRLKDADGEGGDADPLPSDPIFRGSDWVGYVTSGGTGFRLNKRLALGYVKQGLNRPGADFEVGILGERRKARAVPTPFYDPENARLRA